MFIMKMKLRLTINAVTWAVMVSFWDAARVSFTEREAATDVVSDWISRGTAASAAICVADTSSTI